MAGLVSPKPVSYLQHMPYHPYSTRTTYSDQSPLPPSINSINTHQHQPQIPGGFTSGSPASVSAVGSTLGVSEEAKIYALVIDLLDPVARESALLELSKKREQYDDLALVLWHSFGMKFSPLSYSLS